MKESKKSYSYISSSKKNEQENKNNNNTDETNKLIPSLISNEKNNIPQYNAFSSNLSNDIIRRFTKARRK